MHTKQASIAERLLGVGSVLLAVVAVVATLALGWLAVWHAGLRELPICQELMGRRRQTPEAKQRIADEIQQIKRVHRRPAAAASAAPLGAAASEGRRTQR
jgi:hypothetical protein